MQIDLNCDVGEGAPHDAELLEVATSASIACGLHAGDPSIMRRTVDLALARGVAVGAHPGYADREGMGRRDVGLLPDEIRDLVAYQIGALEALARSAGTRLQHVKLHGALYHAAARHAAVADAAAEAITSVDPSLVFVGLPGTEHERAMARAGLRFAAEVFADRAYGPDGMLIPRTDPQAFITDPKLAADRVLGMLRDGRVETASGASIALRADTVCIHGDNPAALAFARAVAGRLLAAGIEICALAERG